ncbi:sec-independent protein translocase protein TatC [Alicyclobacillus contaminans]|uniref:twin-arginine translocase subunit TatC n=1 Tax=Alicyclobacillus contaminans TaxID=392016 RepID=UPI00040BE0DD|nr:twin-arginine translocase subunit TatC [Alicyclobacillus contaminans]GMA50355.1 sec-independent protein translocase protein TatC [Alicyclobacillus contaminans]
MTPAQMTFVEHLNDLRKRLISICVVFVVLLIGCFVFVSRIYGYLVEPLTREGYRLMVTSPGEVVMVYMSMAGLVSAGLTLPFALYQIWRFVKPGLTPTEQRYTLRLLPAALLMFGLGLCFSWFVVFPAVLHFLLHLAQERFTVMLRAGSYFGFLTSICLPLALVFELPLVVVFLTRIGLVTPRFLRKMRRYAYFVCVLIGVLISPPELVSHLSVVLPMIFLYELSILLSALVQRRRQKQPDAGGNTA